MPPGDCCSAVRSVTRVSLPCQLRCIYRSRYEQNDLVSSAVTVAWHDPPCAHACAGATTSKVQSRTLAIGVLAPHVQVRELAASACRS